MCPTSVNVHYTTVHVHLRTLHVPIPHPLRTHTRARARPPNQATCVTLTTANNGPGCNHLKYDFMEKILKIHDSFDLNLHSIFSYHEKNIFLKIRPKTPFWRSKTAKNWKNTFLSLFGFLSRKREMTPTFLFHFSIPYRLG